MVLQELEANLSCQGEEVAAFAEQQREVSGWAAASGLCWGDMSALECRVTPDV